MKVISTEIIIDGDKKYKVVTYDNGTVVKSSYSDYQEPLPTLSETDEVILNTNANVEYLVALKELEV